ncbi:MULTISPECIES: spore germination protein GerPB [Peribacillus]|uniref:spore germination protein GerPB n=1 Tax=Peribacillus TaxID=2675229 RepID=UPI00191284A1|nr:MULTISPECIES: spore germination protein GerPB [unclassified Peribacillus]MBK5445476.1 spore gernimation protein [Peribacillus sp. TH24]MBK5459802.1 spore gernimation protein [Peribacillus sp. TH27]MBK5481611.1 spore gernimation protein [Peribacillus sp. TH16]MBK5497992.1 spore gernimation protein [Peribacillus sp. TH14]WMX56894.1 spore germination protein GerPB [Peribacillus sp. R9-11]
MIFNIHQTIQINMIKIESIANSSVFQIGSAGVIKPYSELANTGGYTTAAPQIEADVVPETTFVPFRPPNS